MIYIIVLAGLGYVLLNNGKVQIHRSINSYVGNAILDTFFKYITHLGDGLFAFTIALIIVFVNVRKSLYILFSYAGAALVSSILKRVVYTDICRPHFVFQYFVREDLKEVQGVELAGFHSFPSGHALSAFALFFCLLFISRNQALKILFFLLAFTASFSRVYLSQHWLIDIYVGSVIGTGFSILFYFIFYKNKSFNKLDKPLMQLISKNKPGV